MDGMKVLIDIIREKEGKCVYVVVVKICITTTYTLTQIIHHHYDCHQN